MKLEKDKMKEWNLKLEDCTQKMKECTTKSYLLKENGIS